MSGELRREAGEYIDAAPREFFKDKTFEIDLEGIVAFAIKKDRMRHINMIAGWEDKTITVTKKELKEMIEETAKATADAFWSQPVSFPSLRGTVLPNSMVGQEKEIDRIEPIDPVRCWMSRSQYSLLYPESQATISMLVAEEQCGSCEYELPVCVVADFEKIEKDGIKP